MFKVGDAVRVKAGVRTDERFYTQVGTKSYPRPHQVGVRLEAVASKVWPDGDTVVYFPTCNVYGDGISEEFLEPWNDAEEWDGAKWVAKKTEKKRWFRVKHNWPYGVRCGDVASLVKEKHSGHGWGHTLLLDGPQHWEKTGLGDSPYIWFGHNDVEEITEADLRDKPEPTPPKPAVVMYGKYATYYESTNKAVKVAEELSKANPGTEYVVYQEKASFKVEPKPSGGYRGIARYNVSAETPPKPAVVLRSDGKGALRYPSTNSAVKEAKILSESNPGTEYVVYQEKASFKVEPKPSKAELLEESLLQERLRDITSQMHDCNDSHICDVKVVSLSRDENLVTVTYKVQP